MIRPERGATMHKEEFIRSVRALTLADIEIGMRGHVSSHQKMSDKELINRVVREKRYGASVFDITSEELLEKIKDVLLNEEDGEVDGIVEWLNDLGDGDNYVAWKEYNEVLGHGYYHKKWHEWKKGAMKCSELAVVLKKVYRKHDVTYKIITAYCEPSDKDKKNFV